MKKFIGISFLCAGMIACGLLAGCETPSSSSEASASSAITMPSILENHQVSAAFLSDLREQFADPELTAQYEPMEDTIYISVPSSYSQDTDRFLRSCVFAFSTALSKEGPEDPVHMVIIYFGNNDVAAFRDLEGELPYQIIMEISSQDPHQEELIEAFRNNPLMYRAGIYSIIDE